MNYKELANIYAKQKADLGMSESYIAKRAGLSQSTVHRIFTGRHNKAAFDDMIAIGKVLGIEIGRHGIGIKPSQEILENAADKIARVIATIMMASSQLEGQGIDEQARENLILKTKIELLAGPRSKIWIEE